MTELVPINDVGTDLKITIKEDDAIVDISTAIGLNIILRKPGGGEVVKAATLLTDGTDGILHYQTEAGVIDKKGVWYYRAKITFTASMIFYSPWAAQFEVVK